MDIMLSCRWLAAAGVITDYPWRQWRRAQGRRQWLVRAAVRACVSAHMCAWQGSVGGWAGGWAADGQSLPQLTIWKSSCPSARAGWGSTTPAWGGRTDMRCGQATERGAPACSTRALSSLTTTHNGALVGDIGTTRSLGRTLLRADCPILMWPAMPRPCKGGLGALHRPLTLEFSKGKAE